MRISQAVILACALALQQAAATPYGAVPAGVPSYAAAPDYTYSYSSGVAAAQESRAGSLAHGAFSYVDANGQVQSRSYVADDKRGFVVTASDAQEPVRDTPEVARARQEHLEAVARAQALVSGVQAPQQSLQGPQPVADTPEVAAARAHHLAIVQDAHARSGTVFASPTPLPVVQQPWGVSSTPAPVQDTIEVAAAKAKHLAAVEEAKAKLAAAEVRSGVTSHQQQSYSAGYSQQHQQAVFAVTAAPPTPVEDTVEVAAAKAQHLAAVAQAASRVSSSSQSIAAQYAAPSAAPFGVVSRFHYPNVPSDLSPRFPAPAPAPIAAPAWPTVAVRYNTIADVEDASGRYVPDDEGRYIPSREDAEGQYDPRYDAEGQYDARLNDEGHYVPSQNDEGQWAPSANEGQYVPGREDQSGEDNMPYSYSYSDGLSSKTETKTADGLTRGRFSYVDANGVLQAVEYESDNVNGFRASGTNLPQAQPVAGAGARVYRPPGPAYAYAAPQPVPAYRAPVAAYGVPAPLPRPIAAAYAAPAPAVGVPDVPADTPEVAAAKAAHFAAHREAGARLANAYGR